MRLNDILTEFCFRPSTPCDCVRDCIENGTFRIGEYLDSAYILDYTENERAIKLFEDEFKFIFFDVEYVDSILASNTIGIAAEEYMETIQSKAIKKALEGTIEKINTSVWKGEQNSAECSKNCYMLAFRGNTLIDVYVTEKNPTIIRDYIQSKIDLV